MKRWVHEEPKSRAAQVTEVVRSLEPMPLDLAPGWAAIVGKAQGPRIGWGLAAAFCAAVAVGLIGGVVFMPAGPTVIVSTTTALTTGRDGTFHLAQGTLAITQASSKRITVVTPTLEFDARQCRFMAEVSEHSTLLTVDEGELVVRVDGATRVVRVGSSLRWPPAHEARASSPNERPLVNGRCAETTGALKLECLAAEGRGTGLDAQAALYELGRLQTGDTAIETWSQSLSRFERGVLEPEVRLAIIIELMHQHRSDDALSAAREFEARLPADPRVTEVAALRRSLEQELK